MIEITEFIKKYMAALDQAFPDRVWFAGLQGSYGRGEATEASDIDMVVILDQLSAFPAGSLSAASCPEDRSWKTGSPRSFSSSAATPPP